MRRALRLLGRALGLLLVLGLLAGGALYLASLEGMGAVPEGARLARNQRSPQWTGAHFDNVIPAKHAAPVCSRASTRPTNGFRCWAWPGSPRC